MTADWTGPIKEAKKDGTKSKPPRILTCDELLETEAPMEKMLFDTFPVPAAGLTLVVGASKGGKTVLGTQLSIAAATGNSLFDYYRVLEKGPVLIVERDDPRGPVALKTQIKLGGCTVGTPLYTTGESPEGFGPAMIEWLEEQITKLSLKLVVLDSYTAIRAERRGSSDIVKIERAELERLDSLGKRHGCAIILIHHGSKSAADLDWTMSGSGSFAMFAAAEALCHVSRFVDGDGDPERLVRIRGRHSSDLYLALRFQKQTLGYEYVLEGGAAPLYPLLRRISGEFQKEPFTIKMLMDRTELSKAHAYRQIDRLRRADAVAKLEGNEYVLAVRL
jgi:RecA-family ATPase